MIQEMPLSMEEAQAVVKVLTRALHPLDTICPDCQAKQPKARISPSEQNYLSSVVNSLNKSLIAYKEQLEANLKQLGPQGFIDGDGILRISGNEWRAFKRVSLGTELVGTFGTEREARRAWSEAKKSTPDTVDIYQWQSTGLVMFEDLAQDPEIRKYVTLTDRVDPTTSIIDGDTEGFRGSDYP